MTVCSVASGAALPEPAFTRVGLTWSPWPFVAVRFGVGSVLGEGDSQRVELAEWPVEEPGGWWMTVRAKAGELILCRGGAVRVLTITPPDPDASSLPGSPGHGGVTLQAVPRSEKAADDSKSAWLPDGGWLNLTETDAMQQNTARVETWLPDAAHPFGAVLTWTYDYLSTGLAKPEDVHRATVHAGADLVIGTHKLHVISLLAKSPEHPAYLQIDIQ